MKQNPVFALLHVRVRNDYPCPQCREYSLSFHATIDDVCENAYLLEDKDVLRNHHSDWVYEWERRGNGDRYVMFPIINGKSFELTSLDKMARWSLTDLDGAEMASYVVVTCELSKDWCPDDISYSIEFCQCKPSENLDLDLGTNTKVFEISVGRSLDLNLHFSDFAKCAWS